MLPELVLVHSPLTGDVTWQPVAEVLLRRGREVSVPSLAAVFSGAPGEGGGSWYSRLVAAALPERSGRPVVLVAHSGAGALMPAVAAALAPSRPVLGTVYADAVLPHPGHPWFDTAPPELAEQLRGLARDGRLPPWDEWFPAEVLAGLLPDPAVRAGFRAGLPRLPLAYFEEPAPEGDLDTDPARTAYLRLSEAYEGVAARAEGTGYRVLRYAGHHLAMLTEPVRIADALEDLTPV